MILAGCPIQELRLYKCSISDDGIVALVEALLGGTHHITQLDVGGFVFHQRCFFIEQKSVWNGGSPGHRSTCAFVNNIAEFEHAHV